MRIKNIQGLIIVILTTTLVSCGGSEQSKLNSSTQNGLEISGISTTQTPDLTKTSSSDQADVDETISPAPANNNPEPSPTKDSRLSP